MNSKTIGILGGMGPGATAMLYSKIISRTPAETDQQHLHVIIDSDPSVPDRSKNILQGGPSPAPTLNQMAMRLQNAGAEVLILPCNTAHYFIDEALHNVDLPFIHIIDETIKTCQAILPKDGRVGLLATSATISSRVYHDRFSPTAFRLMAPKDDDQQQVMDGIYNGVKAGRFDYGADRLKNVAENLISGGAQLIIGGCTEIPLVLRQEDLKVPFMDTLDILADAAVTYALAKG